MYEIEAAARMKHTAIVNNTNLGNETDAEIIDSSADFAREISEKTGLPLEFTTCPENIAMQVKTKDIFPVRVYVKPLWER